MEHWEYGKDYWGNIDDSYSVTSRRKAVVYNETVMRDCSWGDRG